MAEPIYAAVDLEMTGLKPGFDEIIEVGIIRCTPDRVLQRWSTLIKPLETPPLRIQRLTGITEAMLREAPRWDEVEGQIRELLKGAALLGHNVGFDERFLEVHGIRPSLPSVDTVRLAQIIDPTAPSHRLGDLCERYRIQPEEAHRALADADAARRVFIHLRERMARLPGSARDDLAQVAVNADQFWESGHVLRQWVVGVPRSAGRAAVADAPLPRPLEPAALPEGTLAELTERAFASAGGSLERREEQLAMARDVADTLQYGGRRIVEAGTGTGKSLAYLVPAALWALKCGQTVLVSTHTINLQQQLLQKDVDLARELVAGVAPRAARALTAAVAKGRGNYLCQEMLDRELSRVSEWPDPLLLARAAVWRGVTEEGDNAELRLASALRPAWSKLSAADTRCLSDRSCEYVNNGHCFLQRMQRRAAASHLVIVNHALLVRSIIGPGAILPHAPVVIIDEAHALEDVATDQLSFELSEPSLQETAALATEARDSLQSRTAQTAFPDAADHLRAPAKALEQAAKELFQRVGAFAAANAGGNRFSDERVTIGAGLRGTKDWEAVVEAGGGAVGALSGLAEELGKLADRLAGEAASDDAALKQLSFDALRLQGQAMEQTKELQRAVTEQSEADVAWATRESRRSGAGSLNVAPLSVADSLLPLWAERHAAVLTGATLSLQSTDDANFDFLRERLGLLEAEESRYGSPFDFARRCRIYVPTDGRFPQDDGYDDFVAEAVGALTVAAGGRTMALFISHRAKNQAADATAARMEAAGLTQLRQGRDGPPARIVEELRADPRAAAFGVASLWTGVDVPGEALSLLIIARLPFVPPNDPVHRARAEQYEDAFNDYQVPKAVLQFRQGVGRLIRSRSDIGAAVILDPRIVRTRYGRQFKAALPPAPFAEKPLAQIAAEVQQFLPRPSFS